MTAEQIIAYVVPGSCDDRLLIPKAVLGLGLGRGGKALAGD